MASFRLLHEEVVSQLSEVGKQIRFLSDQIGDNRTRLMTVRTELATEMVRLNESLGATRVQISQDIAGFEDLKGALGRIAATPVSLPAAISEEIGRRLDEAHRKLSEDLERRGSRIASGGFPRHVGAGRPNRRGSGRPRREAQALTVEVKATHKALTSLAKKFDRFDDKISVQVKDQDQRLRKLERQARG